MSEIGYIPTSGQLNFPVPKNPSEYIGDQVADPKTGMVSTIINAEIVWDGTELVLKLKLS